MKSNGGVNSRTQIMAWNDFPLLNHPSIATLSLISQSDKHHKEPMFLAIYVSVLLSIIMISILHHFVYKYFVSKFIISLIHVCPTDTGDF